MTMKTKTLFSLSMSVMLSTGAAGLFSVVALPSRALGAQCPELSALVERALPPEVGDPAVMTRLLNPTVGPQLSKGFDRKVTEAAVHDQLTSSRGCLAPAEELTCRAPAPFCTYENTTGSSLLVDLGRGRLKYVNRARGFNANEGIPNAVSKPDALNAVLGTVTKFGVPRAELGPSFVNALMAASQDAGRRTTTQTLRAEVNVRLLRQVQGTPVLGSDARVVIDRRGEVARLQVSWPDFRLSPGLAASDTLPRKAVAEALAEAIGAENDCGTVARVEARIAYVPGRDAGGQGKADGPPAGDGYVPALVVFLTPPEPAEGSGKVTLAEQQLVMPLLRTAGD
jgi:hypothetical protein